MNALKRRKQYHKRLNKGLCPHCGGERDIFGIIGCSKCNNRLKKYKTTKEKVNQYQRDYISRNRAKGVCTTCGRSLEPGFKRCSVCRERTRRYYSKAKKLISIY